MDYEEVKSKSIRGIVALTGRAILLQGANFITFNLLAAFLGSVNIGVFIAISAIRDIFNLFIDVGLGAAIVQKKEEVTQNDLSSTFVIQEFLVVGIVIIGFLLTNWVKQYLNLDYAGTVLYWVLLITLLINSLKVIPSILLERKLEFEKQIFPQLIEAVIFDVVVVLLAWKSFGLFSYSWAVILGSVAGLIGYYIVSPWRPIMRIKFSNALKLVSFGLQFQGKSYLSVIKDQLLTLFLTKTVGFIGIGYWGFAQRWAYSPFRFIVDSVTKVTFPAYSRLQNDADFMRKGIEKSLFMVSLILFPSLVIISLLGRSFVLMVPRLHQYEPALLSLYILCIQAGISALSNILVNALDANGRVKTTLGLMVMWIVLIWVFTVGLVGYMGFTGIALAQLLVSLTIVVTIYLVKQMVEFSFVKSVFKPVLATLLMVITGYALVNSFSLGVLTSIITVLISAIIYCIAIFVLANKEIMENAKILLSVYKK